MGRSQRLRRTPIAQISRGLDGFAPRLGLRKLVDGDLRADVSGNLAEMAMVTQADYLPDPGRLCEQPERLFGAEVIESLQNVVRNKGHGAILGHKLVVAGHAQRKVELKTRALRRVPTTFV